MVTFDEVFALAVEIGTPPEFLPTPDQDLDAQYQFFLGQKRDLEIYHRETAGMFADLEEKGLPTDLGWLGVHKPPAAVPILLKWLPEVTHNALRMQMIQVLAAKQFKRETLEPLKEDFWSVLQSADARRAGIPTFELSAISQLLTKDDAEFLLSLAANRAVGSPRMVAIRTLAKWSTLGERVVPVLLQVLKEDAGVGEPYPDYSWEEAAVGLSRLGVVDAIPLIRQRLAHATGQSATNLRKALKKLESIEAASGRR